jgi:VWFA-related protein
VPLFFGSPRFRPTIALFCSLAIVTVSAQDIPTISVNVKVVNVLATVRDKHGKIVNSLGKDDFLLEEDGSPQTIRYFVRETDIPLTLGLLVDTSLSQRDVIEQERNASGAFVNDVLRADKDTAFLIHFDSEVELLQDLTSSPLKISSALQEIQLARPDRSGGQYPGGGGGGGRQSRAGTLLYDSIFLASDELMQKQKGRKAIVILTDGVDQGSKLSMERAIESAQRADTMVYTIYFTGSEGGGWIRHGGGMGWPGGGGRRGGGWPGGGGGYPQPRMKYDGKKVLERISRETGGRMFEVGKKETITQIFADIQDELRNQYNLGYTPDQKDTAVDYRHIKVTAKQKDLTVQAREGYYASKQLESKPAQGIGIGRRSPAVPATPPCVRVRTRRFGELS